MKTKSKYWMTVSIDMPSNLSGLRKAMKWIDRNRRGALKGLDIRVHSDGHRVSIEVQGEYSEKLHDAIDRAVDRKGSPVIAWTVGSKAS